MKGSGLSNMLIDILATSIQNGAIKMNESIVEDLTWPEFFEGGEEVITATLSRFVGGDSVMS